MTELVERVAKALSERTIRSARRWDTPAEKLEEMLPAAIEHNWRDHVEDARAAVKAMREPTEAMIEAHYRAHAEAKSVFASAEVVFRSMIDAALSPSIPPKKGEGNAN